MSDIYFKLRELGVPDAIVPNCIRDSRLMYVENAIKSVLFIVASGSDNVQKAVDLLLGVTTYDKLHTGAYYKYLDSEFIYRKVVDDHNVPSVFFSERSGKLRMLSYEEQKVRVIETDYKGDSV